MIGYERLIYDMIEGITPREKYDNLRGMINACTTICYPRRGTSDDDMTIHEAANMLVQYIKNPNLKDDVMCSDCGKLMSYNAYLLHKC